MGSLFSSKKKPKKDGSSKFSEQDKAVVEIKRRRDRLRKYAEKMIGLIEREVSVARALAAKGQRERALLALRKKRKQQSLLQQAETQLENLEELVNSIRFAQLEKEVFEAMKLGTQTLDEINSEMSIEDVEMLMEETREAMEYQEELSRVLGSSLTEEDAAEVDQEFEDMMKQITDEEALQMPSVPERGQQQPLVEEEAGVEHAEEELEEEEEEEEDQQQQQQRKVVLEST